MMAGGFDLPGGRRRAALSLVPLIDVTFILLIFFMLVTQFQRLAPVDVTLSASQIQPEDPATRQQGRPFVQVVTLRADGSILLNGDPGAISDLPRMLQMASAVIRLVELHPDPGVPLQTLIDAMMTIQQAEGVTVQITEPRQDGEAKE